MKGTMRTTLVSTEVNISFRIRSNFVRFCSIAGFSFSFFNDTHTDVSKTNGHHTKSTSDDVVDLTDEDDIYNEDASADDRDDHDDRYVCPPPHKLYCHFSNLTNANVRY